LFTTDFKLLLELCRCSFSSCDLALAQELGAAADWERLVRLARFHRVQGLVAHACRILAVAPPAERHTLSADAELIAAASLRQAVECREILEAAVARGVPLLFLKGLTVGALAYGNPALKMGWDIDLLISPGDLPSAADLLQDRGYELVIPKSPEKLGSWHGRHKESVWALSSNDMYVELHTRLADNGQLIPGISVRSCSQLVEVARDIQLPTLAPDQLFAYLCVHGASSAWFRLKWITDFAALASRRSPNELEQLYARSQELGAGRAAAQALLTADRLYGTLSGSTLGRSLRRSRANRLLADAALQQLAGAADPIEPTSVRFGTWRIHWTQFLLRPGLGFKVEEFARQIGTAIA
jgi:hypothetical protein